MRNLNVHVFLERDGCRRVVDIGNNGGGGSFLGVAFEGWGAVKLGEEAPLPTMRMRVSVSI